MEGVYFPVAMPSWTSSPAGIIIPGKPRACRRCTTCGAEYPMEQKSQFIRHLEHCARVNEDVLAQEVEDNTKDSDFINVEPVWEEIQAAKKGKL